jgi:hypothetical protein
VALILKLNKVALRTSTTFSSLIPHHASSIRVFSTSLAIDSRMIFQAEMHELLLA